jgi:hypothetical protein
LQQFSRLVSARKEDAASSSRKERDELVDLARLRH